MFVEFESQNEDSASQRFLEVKVLCKGRNLGFLLAYLCRGAQSRHLISMSSSVVNLNELVWKMWRVNI